MKIFISTLLVYISFLFSILGQHMGLVALPDDWGSIFSFILYISYSVITPFLFIYCYYLKKYNNNKIFYNLSKNICIINIILNLSYCFITSCEFYILGNFLYFIPFEFKNHFNSYFIINLILIFTYIILTKYKKLNKFFYILSLILAIYFVLITLLFFSSILFFIISNT